MSLQLAAQHLAHHGRGDDKMLVHMTPKEVSGLQQLAQMHGGSLTVNPHTGLPEAGILDSLLPTIIGAGLSFIPGVGPLMAAGIVGSLQAARTGDLGKGLLAGLGAYGGAGLAGGFAEAGANAMTTAGVGDYASTLANRGIEAGTPAFGEEAGKIALESQKQALGASMGDKLSAGYTAATASPSAAMQFAKDNWKSGLMALSPIVADQMVQTTTPPTNTAQIHPFRYAGGRYERLPAVSADKFQGFADGGMAQDNAAGGGMFNYAQMQPAVDLHPNSGVGPQNMAEGGVAHFDWGGEVTAAVNAGRMGFAPGTSAQDVVNSFNLNQDQAAQVAQQLGYTGDIKGLNYGAASSNPATYASAAPSPSTGFDMLQNTENVLYPKNTPVYSNYSNQDYANFFADPKNAAVLQTPGGLAAAEAQYNADPRAVNNYIAGLATNYSDPTATQNGSGTLGTYQNLIRENVMPAAYTTAQKAVNPNFGKTGDYWNSDTVAKAYQVADKVLKFDPLTDNVTPSDKEWVAFMDKNNISTKDISIATGLSQNEVDKRYNAVKATPTTTTTPTPATTSYSGISIGLPTNATAPVPGTSNVTQTVLPTNSGTNAPAGTANPYGNQNNPGDVTFNADGSRTVQPNIPGRPYGGFSGMDELTKAYTAGGGHLGQVLKPTQTYQNTGGSKAAYDYLSGLGSYAATKTQPATKAKNTYSNFSAPTADEIKQFSKYAKVYKDGVPVDNPYYNKGAGDANGGLMSAMASGGQAHYNLGGYSDGGRLLRGPGDGVSDSIPATIGNKQPARLADGEFVVPARIVSEIGNGSTEAGARKLYAMMDRVQSARSKTVGKGKIAKNTRADKYLPA